MSPVILFLSKIYIGDHVITRIVNEVEKDFITMLDIIYFLLWIKMDRTSDPNTLPSDSFTISDEEHPNITTENNQESVKSAIHNFEHMLTDALSEEANVKLLNDLIGVFGSYSAALRGKTEQPSNQPTFTATEMRDKILNIMSGDFSFLDDENSEQSTTQEDLDDITRQQENHNDVDVQEDGRVSVVVNHE